MRCHLEVEVDPKIKNRLFVRFYFGVEDPLLSGGTLILWPEVFFFIRERLKEEYEYSEVIIDPNSQDSDEPPA